MRLRFTGYRLEKGTFLRGILLLVIMGVVCVCCCSCKEKITEVEHPKKLKLPEGFDPAVLAILEDESGEEPERLYVLEGHEKPVPLNGVSIPISEEESEEALTSLRATLRPMGYLVFWTEQCDEKPSKIGVMKGTDQFDILRAKRTAGLDYDIDNKRLIAELKKWNKRYPLEIIGADREWVEVEFASVPRDVDSFAQEVHDFSPDVVDQGLSQGISSPEELAESIRQTKRLYLWWR